MLSYVKVSQVLSILQIEFVYATVGLASPEGWTLILKVKDASLAVQLRGKWQEDDDIRKYKDKTIPHAY
ncbi:hypothetical protein EUGRSUZ_B00606 [Eucalyptus grandis]|uniref:Uncharacterized protein n=2 Tax=Eucalyptus grandis TaxID=71139 RepID=A0ACC3LNA4_EUCGR|nr:hypothetical protein EUGRSUZ_B00606 [Eucalyptus grandis]